MRRERLEGGELERTLGDIAAALVDDLDPERIILFGSFARGDQNRASDLDLVVVAETDLPFCERIGRALESCSRASPLAVEPLVYTPSEWNGMIAQGRPFARLVEKEGRVLHERGSKPGGRRTVASPSPA